MSVPYTGDYAPELFSEGKRYYLFQAQQLSNLTDAELRDMHSISNTFLRRFINSEIGNGSPNDGFKVKYNSSDPVNNFLITGGDGSLDNPGAFFVKGFYLFLKSDLAYKDQTTAFKTIEDDGYTKTVLPSLTTPTGTLLSLNSVDVGITKFFSVGNAGIVTNSEDYGRNWSDGTSVSAGVTLNDTYMIDNSSGYAAGSGGNVYVYNGSVWSSDPIPGAPTTDFYGLAFIDSNTGWVVGDSGKVYQKSLGAWNGTPNSTDTAENLKSVWAADATNAWAVGAKGAIVHTVNGQDVGVFWHDQISPVGDTSTLNKVFGRTTSLLYVAGENGLLMKTINGGTSWSVLPSTTSQDLYGLWFVNDNTGWAVGEGGIALKTGNAGSSWSSQIVADGTDFRSVAFLNDSTGFIVGSNGAIYRTLDATSWERYRTDTAYIDMYLAEVSADTTGGSEYLDTDLEDSVIGLPSANRLRIVSDVRVSEGWPATSDYVDSSRQHYTASIAKILRTPTVPGISDITDTRNRIFTLSEITNLIRNGGLDASSIAPGSITPSKLDPTGAYTFGSVVTSGDTTIGGNLEILGGLKVTDYTASMIMDHILVNGSAVLGDPSLPYDDTVSINGRVIQRHDTSAVGYDLYSASTTSNATVINILSEGSGTVFNVSKTSDSTKPLIDLQTAGKGTEITAVRSATLGGFLNLRDDASGNSITIDKLGLNDAGSVFNITTNKTDPSIAINNISALSSKSIKIDQTTGTMVQLTSHGNASILALASSGSGTDISLVHSGTTGMAVDLTSYGSGGALSITNYRGQAMRIAQESVNDTLLELTKDGTGDGRVLELYNSGYGTAFQINNDGSGIAQHISHVGDSTEAGLHVYVAGNERGPAIYVDKANNDIGALHYLRNGGLSETFDILQDNTDSSASVFKIDNRGTGCDFSSAGWRIFDSTMIISDISSTSWRIDGSGNLRINSIIVDYSAFDSSNPGISGKFYRDSSNFLKISAG